MAFQLTQLFDLTGRIALITGSSRGLGYTFAEGLAQAGATVVLNGQNPERLAQAVDEFAEKPDLETAGWLPRLELKDVVYFEKWNEQKNSDWENISKLIKENLDYA